MEHALSRKVRVSVSLSRGFPPHSFSGIGNPLQRDITNGEQDRSIHRNVPRVQLPRDPTVEVLLAVPLPVGAPLWHSNPLKRV